MGLFPDQIPVEANGLLRLTQGASPRRSALADAASLIACIAIALLIVTVGALATETRLANVDGNTTSWHTSKISRMMECGGDRITSPQTDHSRPVPLITTTQPIAYLSSSEMPAPELADAPHEHGLRAPPRA